MRQRAELDLRPFKDLNGNPFLPDPAALRRQYRPSFYRGSEDRVAPERLIRALKISRLTVPGPKYFSSKFESKFPLTHHPGLSGAVAIPIGVDTEDSGDIRASLTSVKEAAAQCSKPLLVATYANYTADERRGEEHLAEMQVKAEKIERIVTEVMMGANVDLLTMREQLPPGTSFSILKERMLIHMLRRFGIHPLATNNRGSTEPHPVNHLHAIAKVPVFTVDIDTQVPPKLFAEGIEVLTRKKDQAIFFNGTHYYTGGIMDLSPREVSQDTNITTNEKLVYFAEMMRRKMFDDLLPAASRGYLIDDSTGLLEGTLVSLGGISPYSPQNESHLLQKAALRAFARYLTSNHVTNDYSRVDDPDESYLPVNTAEFFTEFIHYSPSVIRTSARGLFGNVAKRGRWALVDYDQGKEYLMNSDIQRMEDGTVVEPEPSQEELFALVNGIYTHFAKDGGQLVGSDVRETVELFNTLFPGNETIVAWFPPKVEQTLVTT